MSLTDKDIRFAIEAENRFSGTFRQLDRDMSRASSAAASMTGAFGSVQAAIGRVAVGAALAILAQQVRALVDEVDALNDASDAVGDTVENISALEDLARRNGGGLDLVSTALNKLNKTLGEAKTDSPLGKALEDIGLKASDLRSLDPSEALRQVAVALARYENDQNKARIVQELFGKSSREVAAFLKDLAEAGTLNATVTSRQAAEAEKFNKELFALSTNAGNAARALVGPLVEGLNQSISRFRQARAEFGLFGAALELAGPAGAKNLDAAGAAKRLTGELAELQRQRTELVNDSRPLVRSNPRALAEIDAEIAKLKQREQFWNRISLQESGADFGPPAMPLSKLPDRTNDPDKKKAQKEATTEAERYLDILVKQLDKAQELTSVQQAGLDIQRGIDGLGKKVAVEQIIKLAQQIDLQKELNKQKEREQAIGKAINDKTQGDVNAVLSSLSTTPSGRLAGITAQADQLLEFSRRLAENDPQLQQVQERMLALREEAEKLDLQRQIEQLQRLAREVPRDSEAYKRYANDIELLRDRMSELPAPVDAAATQFDKLLAATEGFADKTIDALVQLASGADTSAKSLFNAFRADLLKEFIEDPVRESMRNVVKTIREELKKAGEGSNPFESVLKWLNSLGGEGGGDGWLGSVLSFFGGGTTRAMGGDVRKGQMVRWQENGREWFVPQQDGTVVTQRQMAASAAGAAVGGDTVHVHVNGDVGPQTVALIRRMLDEREAQSSRRQRYGARS